jgi:hypothetical protein
VDVPGQTLTAGDLRGLRSSLERLNFSFDRIGPDVVRGFSDNAVVELRGGRRAGVSVLVSAAPGRRWSARSSVCLATISQALDIDFTQWLKDCLLRQAYDEPWKASQHFADTTVTAEYLCADAVLLSIATGMAR